MVSASLAGRATSGRLFLGRCPARHEALHRRLRPGSILLSASTWTAARPRSSTPPSPLQPRRGSSRPGRRNLSRHRSIDLETGLLKGVAQAGLAAPTDPKPAPVAPEAKVRRTPVPAPGMQKMGRGSAAVSIYKSCGASASWSMMAQRFSGLKLRPYDAITRRRLASQPGINTARRPRKQKKGRRFGRRRSSRKFQAHLSYIKVSSTRRTS